MQIVVCNNFQFPIQVHLERAKFRKKRKIPTGFQGTEGFGQLVLVRAVSVHIAKIRVVVYIFESVSFRCELGLVPLHVGGSDGDVLNQPRGAAVLPLPLPFPCYSARGWNSSLPAHPLHHSTLKLPFLEDVLTTVTPATVVLL